MTENANAPASKTLFSFWLKRYLIYCKKFDADQFELMVDRKFIITENGDELQLGLEKRHIKSFYLPEECRLYYLEHNEIRAKRMSELLYWYHCFVSNENQITLRSKLFKDPEEVVSSSYRKNARAMREIFINFLCLLDGILLKGLGASDRQLEITVQREWPPLACALFFDRALRQKESLAEAVSIYGHDITPSSLSIKVAHFYEVEKRESEESRSPFTGIPGESLFAFSSFYGLSVRFCECKEGSLYERRSY